MEEERGSGDRTDIHRFARVERAGWLDSSCEWKEYVTALSESSRPLFGNKADTWRAHVLGARQVLTLMKRNEKTKGGFMDNNFVRGGGFLRVSMCARRPHINFINGYKGITE